jgi:hypothetical protein
VERTLKAWARRERACVTGIYGGSTLPDSVVLNASPAGQIVPLSSDPGLNPDHIWSGHERVTNTEAGSSVPQEASGRGAYSSAIQHFFCMPRMERKHLSKS